MNLITYYGAYSLYPKATFEERRTLICATVVDHERAIQKYQSRGWKLQFTIPREEQINTGSSLRFEDRWVGDNKCWFLPFYNVSWRRNLYSSKYAVLEVDPVTLNSFNLA